MADPVVTPDHHLAPFESVTANDIAERLLQCLVDLNALCEDLADVLGALAGHLFLPSSLLGGRLTYFLRRLPSRRQRAAQGAESLEPAAH